MPWKCEKVHESSLAAARTAEEYALHQAALEWSLAEPIIIQSAEDIKSRVGWQDRLQPFAHQVRNLFTFCRRLPVTLLADDVGLGKTISAGLILSELMVRRRVSRTLVVCPKILAPQWEQELDEKFGVTAKVAFGKDLTAELRRQTPVVITTYDSARLGLPEITAGVFDMLILDEAHKLRNLHGTKAAPVLAVRIREALEKRLFKYVLMLTATPLQNRLWDLYSLIDCMTVAQGHRNPLGTPDQFQQKFIVCGSDGRKVQPSQAEEFRSILRQYLARTRRDDAKLKFPQRRVRMLSVQLTDGECRLRDLVARHIECLNVFQQISLAQALMSSPKALAAQMENMAKKGSLPHNAAIEARQGADAVLQPAKLTGLLQLCRELSAGNSRDWRVVVFTLRRETQEAIGRAFEREGITYGCIRGDDAAGNQRALVRFREEPPAAHALVSTDAGSEGINLQVGNILVNYDLPWNPMIVEQRIGRVQRLASRHEFVVVCNLVAVGSVEERVVARLMEKLQLVAHAIGDIEAILESTSSDGDDSEGGTFENRIRELVVQSLIGQDVGTATELARRSIEEAQRHLEESRKEMDVTLGRLDALHEAGPSIPRLTRLAPSVPAKQFVLRAKSTDGGAVQQIGPETYEVQTPGRTKEVVTFEEGVALADAGQGVFMGNPRHLYLPGKPAFERLTQHWVDRAGHNVRDFRPHDGEGAERLAREWCAKIPGTEFVRAEFVAAQTFFQGLTRIKAKTANSVDSFEKLIWGRISQNDHGEIPAENDVKPSPAQLRPSEIRPSLHADIARLVEADKEVSEFCRFYEARLREETAKTDGDPRSQQKLHSDFAPLVYADVVAMEGARYSVGRIDVWFSLDGAHTYQVRLDAVPATGKILAEPARSKCALTGKEVPEPCLFTCAVSGQQVLKHLLVTSEISAREALPEYVARCPISGKLMLPDEKAHSSMSGREGAANLFRPSAISGRLGLSDEIARCEITGAEVLHDELIRSQVSSRLFRGDEIAKSAVSGIFGHRSEFVQCNETRQMILPAEAGRSDLSGKYIRADLLQSSAKPPGCRGTAGEFVVCAATGRQLLRDEAASSAVSRKWFDRDLMRKSAKSGDLALADEMVVCEETGATLLPSETERCTVTGKRVDRRLLSQSEATGDVALTKSFVECEKTQRRVLPRELIACDVTGAKVLPGELEFCTVTGRRVLRDRLLKSGVSERFVLPEKAVRSLLTGAVGVPDEIVFCAWLDGPILKAESGVCRLTGCTFARKFLNKNSELSPLRRLLDGSVSEARKDMAAASWLAEQSPGQFAGIRTLWYLPSPHGDVAAVCAEVSSFFGLALFGVTVRHVGLLVRVRQPRVILGRVISGRRNTKGWAPDA